MYRTLIIAIGLHGEGERDNPLTRSPEGAFLDGISKLSIFSRKVATLKMQLVFYWA